MFLFSLEKVARPRLKTYDPRSLAVATSFRRAGTAKRVCNLQEGRLEWQDWSLEDGSFWNNERQCEKCEGATWDEKSLNVISLNTTPRIAPHRIKQSP